MKPSTLLWCATLVAACANSPAPTSAETAQLTAARQLLDSHPDQALDAVEGLLHANPEFSAARLLAGEGSLRLAQQGGNQAQLHLLDAEHQFERGLEGVADDQEPAARLMLAECKQQLGEFAAASQQAEHAAMGFLAQKSSSSRRSAAEAMLRAGDCDYQLFATARQVELQQADASQNRRVAPAEETAKLAMRAATHYQAARRDYPAEASTGLARINQFLGQDGEVLAELERGLHDAPDATIVHDAYIQWMTDAGQLDALVGAYARLVRDQPSLPILRWHQGRAIYTRAHQLRHEGNYQRAMQDFGKARECFADYLSMVPANREATGQWLAACDLSIASAAAEMGDLATAESRLFAAADACPLTTAYIDGAPQLTDDGGGHFTATVFAIHRALADSSKDALAKTLAFNEHVLQRCPDRFGFVYNNAALAARDLGVQRAAAGDEAGAKQLWERSYDYYRHALGLMPDDARIANDCGLMLVYHLGRDFETARGLFDRAIELGKQQLAALPTDAPQRDRERLEEAVGDAWQNIAVLMQKQQQPFSAYESCCREAVKYFPYQRREAAAMLRQDGDAMADPTAASATRQGGPAEAMAKIAEAVKAKADAGDYDSALSLLDGIAKECKEHAPFHLRRGELTLQLARQARDGGRKGIDLFFQDAVAALKRAVELDGEPCAPRQLLAEAQFDAGELEAAVDTLSSLLLHLQSKGGGTDEQLTAAHLLRARAASLAYQQKKQNQEDDKDLLTAARASFRLLGDQGKLDAELLRAWSVTEQWAGAPAEAVNVYLRAAERSPDDLGLLDSIVSTAQAQSQLPLAIEALAKRQDAGALWYLGKARYLLGDVLRGGNDNPGAQKTLDAAREDFNSSMQKNAGYRDSSEQWIAMCFGKKGSIAFWSDDLTNAETWLLQSAKLRPDHINDDLGLAETTKLGIMRVADKYVRANDLEKAERIYRAASDAANNDVDLLNNAGLFARDYGDQLAKAGKQAQAMAMWEQSYKAYRRAVELAPANVQLRNDCALIAIYYFDRDWDLTKTMLDAAIADGEKTMRDNPPDDPNEKQALDSAIGDCYENLALWHLKHSQDAAAAKAAAEASLQHFPGPRRPGANKHLHDAEQRLRGK